MTVIGPRKENVLLSIKLWSIDRNEWGDMRVEEVRCLVIYHCDYDVITARTASQQSGKTIQSVFIIKASSPHHSHWLLEIVREIGQHHLPHLPHPLPPGHHTNGIVQGCGWCRHFPSWQCDSVPSPTSPPSLLFIMGLVLHLTLTLSRASHQRHTPAWPWHSITVIVKISFSLQFRHQQSPGADETGSQPHLLEKYLRRYRLSDVPYFSCGEVSK